MVELTYRDARFCFIDFETTGLYPKTDAIIEAGALLVSGGTVLRRFQSFVNPGRPIPESSIAIHGIRDEMVADAPYIADVLPEILSLIQDAVIVAHNVNFDLSFLKSACESSGLQAPDVRAIDTCSFARVELKGEKSYSLQNLAQKYQLDGKQFHRALDDAEVCSRLLSHIVDTIPDGRDMPVKKLIRLSRTRAFSMQN